jgi:opacity protein-like surface antigen
MLHEELGEELFWHCIRTYLERHAKGSVMTDDLRSKYSHFSLVPLSSQYEQNLALDSSGPNYGLEIRYYSRGWAGSFSVGLSFEQTSMKLAITGTVKQNYKDGSYAEADVVGSATASVFSTNLSFRWDILPASRVTPYFVLGLGWAPFKADVNETYTGTFTSASGSQESIENTKVKSVADIAADNDFTLPDAIFIVHLGFGLKVNIVYGLSGMVEAGLWDGFLLRFSVACRF